MINLLYKKNKFLIIIFILTFIVFVASCYFANKGLFADNPSLFTFANNVEVWYVYLRNDMARKFANILGALPYNISLIFIHNLPPLYKLNSFYISYLIMSGVLTVFNFYTAKFTKRYDIAILALFAYTFFDLPSAIWVGRENHISIPVYFIVIQYLLTKKTFDYKNKTILLACTIFCLESFELFVPCGILIFIFSILFYLKNAPNKYIKLYIGLTSICSVIYIILKTFFYVQIAYPLSKSTHIWFIHTEIFLKNFFHSNMLILIFGILLLIFSLLLKAKTRKIAISFLSILFLLVLFKETGFYQDKMEHCNYIIIFLAVPAIIGSILISEYFNILKFKLSTIKTFFTISLIIGIINFVWQIKGSYDYYYRYFVPVRNLLNQANTIVSYDLLSKLDFFQKYDINYTVTLRSFFVQADKKEQIIKTLVISEEEMENKDYFLYDKEEEIIEFYPWMKIDVKTKTYDMTPIKNWLIENGRVKTNISSE